MCMEITGLKKELINKGYEHNLDDNQIEEAAEILLNKFNIYKFKVYVF